MLVEISVQNYKSIGERQTLSLVAGAASSRKSGSSVETGNPMVPHVLKSACLFGANGSGKSAFVEAMEFLTEFVEESAKDRQVDSEIDVKPFAYDREWRDSPCEIEVVFVHNKTLYQYGVAMDSVRVYDEWLFENPPEENTRLRKIFTRSFDEDTQEYEWNLNKTHLKGERKSWKNSTRKNALFLSTSVQLNSEDLRPPYEWLTRHFRVVEDVSRLHSGYSVRQFVEKGWKEEIVAFLNSADVPLDGIEIEVGDFDVNELPEDFPKDALGKIGKELKNAKIIKKFETVRRDVDGVSIRLPFSEESAGTNVLFNLAGPLLDTLKSGYTLVIDELHNNLHPLALQYIVGLFASPSMNKFGAQLVFTSHEASILDDSCIHRDQIWFVEKQNLMTRIKPLSLFKTRENVPLQKAYLDGRFGAIPIINELEVEGACDHGETA